jgi:hypothetical protein
MIDRVYASAIVGRSPWQTRLSRSRHMLDEIASTRSQSSPRNYSEYSRNGFGATAPVRRHHTIRQTKDCKVRSTCARQEANCSTTSDHPPRSCLDPSSPLWVISRHEEANLRCPLYPQKRTLLGVRDRSRSERREGWLRSNDCKAFGLSPSQPTLTARAVAPTRCHENVLMNRIA